MGQETGAGSQKPEFRGKILVVKNAFFLFSVLCFLFSAIGCDAFVRKFTRKPKKKDLSGEEMVLAPQEYKAPETPKDEFYRQYFFFWKSWHDELLQALSETTNHKRQLDCAKEAIESLQQLRPLLNAQKQKQLDAHIISLEGLLGSIEKDRCGLAVSRNRAAAERLKRNILKDFSLPRIKDFLG